MMSETRTRPASKLRGLPWSVPTRPAPLRTDSAQSRHRRLLPAFPAGRADAPTRTPNPLKSAAPICTLLVVRLNLATDLGHQRLAGSGARRPFRGVTWAWTWREAWRRHGLSVAHERSGEPGGTGSVLHTRPVCNTLDGEVKRDLRQHRVG